jgi:hypothetical protein
MNPIVILIAKKIAKLYKKLSAVKARSNKVKALLEILRLESLIPELTELSPRECVSRLTEGFKKFSLEQQLQIVAVKKWLSPKSAELIFCAEKEFKGDQKICEYFYSQFLMYSSL